MSGTQSGQVKGTSGALVLTALGVVFGDIGTSPLYAMRECFHSVPLTDVNVLGVLSIIFWTLVVVVTIKYLAYVLQADNRGEGGALALMALAHPHHNLMMKTGRKYWIYLGIFGAALMYGDGMITPAISVLSAVEGLKVATPLFEPYVLPLTVVILIGLFMIQARGTARIGSLFGPFIFVWYLLLGLLGIGSIIDKPEVLWAINPYYGFEYLLHNPWQGFLSLGSVFLVATGGEALYADMGHFGKNPIRIGWYFIAFPGLSLNYFGQGALLLKDHTAIQNPFFHLAPEWLLIPMVVIATLATIIASQAVISGAFSLTSQAITLGLLPRITIKHTSSEEKGQIYVSRVNWALLLATVWLVLEFRTSSNLAAAYGIAVSLTMVITTLLMYFVTVRVWRWNPFVCLAITAIFIIADFTFFASNIIKIGDGGWFPLTVGLSVMILMTTWRRGRQILRERLKEKLPPFDTFVHDIPEMTPIRVPGTAIYMNTYRDLTPPALLHNLKHNKVIHELILIVVVVTEDIPYVSPVRRVEVEKVGKEIFSVSIHFGFMDTQDVPRALKLCRSAGLDFEMSKATFFLGRETILATSRPGMAIWREELFAFMSRNAQKASRFFGIKADQVIEIGFEVEL